jgi:integration host factor subunit beta
MIKSRLIQTLISKHPDLSEEAAARAVNQIIKMLISALATGKRVEIRGFGSLTLRKQKPRSARNPRTGAAVETSIKMKPHFKPGKELRNMVNKAIKKRTAATADIA